MKNPYNVSDISDRQVDVITHFVDVMGVDANKMHFFKSDTSDSAPFHIDVAAFEPTKDFNYYILSTVGLSQYYFTENFARTELMMVMPANWKPILNKNEYGWAIKMLFEIAYQIIEIDEGLTIGQVFVSNEKENPYSEYTDAVGGIVCLPEMFPLDILEKKIVDTYTRFFQLMTINKDDLSKIDEMGPNDFIKYELHDSEGPLMVVPFKPALKGIDKIIKKNESTLKRKD